MMIVYQANDLIDANLLAHRLNDAGIECFVNGGFLTGGIGELPAAGLVTVAVADEQVDEAMAVVVAFKHDMNDASNRL